VRQAAPDGGSDSRRLAYPEVFGCRYLIVQALRDRETRDSPPLSRRKDPGSKNWAELNWAEPCKRKLSVYASRLNREFKMEIPGNPNLEWSGRRDMCGACGVLGGAPDWVDRAGNPQGVSHPPI
jgi:hypothetical protein